MEPPFGAQTRATGAVGAYQTGQTATQTRLTGPRRGRASGTRPNQAPPPTTEAGIEAYRRARTAQIARSVVTRNALDTLRQQQVDQTVAERQRRYQAQAHQQAINEIGGANPPAVPTLYGRTVRERANQLVGEWIDQERLAIERQADVDARARIDQEIAAQVAQEMADGDFRQLPLDLGGTGIKRPRTGTAEAERSTQSSPTAGAGVAPVASRGVASTAALQPPGAADVQSRAASPSRPGLAAERRAATATTYGIPAAAAQSPLGTHVSPAAGGVAAMSLQTPPVSQSPRAAAAAPSFLPATGAGPFGAAFSAAQTTSAYGATLPPTAPSTSSQTQTQMQTPGAMLAQAMGTMQMPLVSTARAAPAQRLFRRNPSGQLVRRQSGQLVRSEAINLFKTQFINRLRQPSADRNLLRDIIFTWASETNSNPSALQEDVVLNRALDYFASKQWDAAPASARMHFSDTAKALTDSAMAAFVASAIENQRNLAMASEHVARRLEALWITPPSEHTAAAAGIEGLHRHEQEQAESEVRQMLSARSTKRPRLGANATGPPAITVRTPTGPVEVPRPTMGAVPQPVISLPTTITTTTTATASAMGTPPTGVSQMGVPGGGFLGSAVSTSAAPFTGGGGGGGGGAPSQLTTGERLALLPGEQVLRANTMRINTANLWNQAAGAHVVSVPSGPSTMNAPPF